MHTKNSPLPRLFKANSVCDTGILSCDIILGILNDCLFTSRPLPLELQEKYLIRYYERYYYQEFRFTN